jgi:hypothetical protein
MKIRIQGFRLVLNPELSLDELIAEMVHRNEKSLRHEGLSRVLTVEETNEHILGAFWTIKGVAKFAEIELASLKRSLKELEPGKSKLEFNFFVLSKKNLNGLYSYHYSSASIPTFGRLLNSLGDVVTNPKKTAELNAVGESGRLRTQKRNAIRNKYENSVECHFLVSRKNLAEVLERWARFKSLQYTVSHIEDSSQDYSGLKPYVRAEITKLAFERNSVAAQLKDAILTFVTERDYTKARIEGVDDGGCDRTIDVEDIPDWFGEVDYGEYLSNPTLLSDDLSKSCMIQYILEAMAERPEYFNVEVR